MHLEDIVYAVTVGDLQEVANVVLGRDLTAAEISDVANWINRGLGNSFEMIEDTLTQEMGLKAVKR